MLLHERHDETIVDYDITGMYSNKEKCDKFYLKQEQKIPKKRLKVKEHYEVY